MQLKINWEFVGKIAIIVGSILFAGLIIFLAVAANKEIIPIVADVSYVRKVEPVKFDIPEGGQLAIGTLSGDLEVVYGGDEPRPIASMAKTITALVVLDAKPLPNDDVYTITAEDVAKYSYQVVNSGSRLFVSEGEELTQRQMLEALMMVSANNIADTLTTWVFGSFENYKIAAENWLAKNGLEQTRIGADASGYDPGTISTPSEMLEIGRLALQNESLREIVGTRTAFFQNVNEVNNTNVLLGEGYLGIKTGNSDEALSCLLFAKEYNGDTVIGVLMGQPFDSTFDSARRIWASLEQNLAEAKIPAGTVVGKYVLPWDGEVEIVTLDDISARTWLNAQPKIGIEPLELEAGYHARVGEITLGGKTSDLRIRSVVPQPSIYWRVGNLDKLK